MYDNIILIGPVGAGKSTVARIISEKINHSLCKVDTIRFEYYKEMGYSRIKAKALHIFKGFKGVYKYWKPFEAYAVKRILSDYPNAVIDFGAGHTVYENVKLFNDVNKILKPYKNIFLLLPTEDIGKSLEILNKRKPCELNELFLKHESNYKLCKHIIYTEGKTIQEICVEIIIIAKGSNN